MVGVVALDFQVLGGLGAVAGGEVEDVGEAAVGLAKPFAGVQFVGPDEILLVLAPKRMVRRRSDGSGQTADGDINDLLGVMRKRRRDLLKLRPRPRQQLRTPLHCQYPGPTDH